MRLYKTMTTSLFLSAFVLLQVMAMQWDRETKTDAKAVFETCAEKQHNANEAINIHAEASNVENNNDDTSENNNEVDDENTVFYYFIQQGYVMKRASIFRCTSFHPPHKSPIMTGYYAVIENPPETLPSVSSS